MAHLGGGRTSCQAWSVRQPVFVRCRMKEESSLVVTPGHRAGPHGSSAVLPKQRPRVHPSPGHVISPRVCPRQMPVNFPGRPGGRVPWGDGPKGTDGSGGLSCRGEGNVQKLAWLVLSICLSVKSYGAKCNNTAA